jgi:hypothetical protein
MQPTHSPQPMPCNPKFHAQAFSRLVSILVFAIAVAGTVAAQGTSPVGPYGFVLNGTYSDASTQGGVALLGLMNFDGAGKRKRLLHVRNRLRRYESGGKRDRNLDRVLLH